MLLGFFFALKFARASADEKCMSILDDNRPALSLAVLCKLWRKAKAHERQMRTPGGDPSPVRIPIDYRYWIGGKPILGRGYIVKAEGRMVPTGEFTADGNARYTEAPAALKVEALGGMNRIDLIGPVQTARTRDGVPVEILEPELNAPLAHRRRQQRHAVAAIKADAAATVASIMGEGSDDTESGPFVSFAKLDLMQTLGERPEPDGYSITAQTMLDLWRKKREHDRERQSEKDQGRTRGPHREPLRIPISYIAEAPYNDREWSGTIVAARTHMIADPSGAKNPLNGQPVMIEAPYSLGVEMLGGMVNFDMTSLDSIATAPGSGYTMGVRVQLLEPIDMEAYMAEFKAVTPAPKVTPAPEPTDDIAVMSDADAGRYLRALYGNDGLAALVAAAQAAKTSPRTAGGWHPAVDAQGRYLPRV